MNALTVESPDVDRLSWDARHRRRHGTRSLAAAQEASSPAALVGIAVYDPIHDVAQSWIASPIGQAVDGLINTLAGSYVIGNGSAGTAEHPDGGAGGWLMGTVAPAGTARWWVRQAVPAGPPGCSAMADPAEPEVPAQPVVLGVTADS